MSFNRALEALKSWVPCNLFYFVLIVFRLRAREILLILCKETDDKIGENSDKKWQESAEINQNSIGNTIDGDINNPFIVQELWNEHRYQTEYIVAKWSDKHGKH